MNPPEKDPLPMGRTAFAKVFCKSWFAARSKVIISSLATITLLSVFLLQTSNHFFPSSTKRQKALFSKISEQDSEELKQLKQTLKDHPHAPLDSALAQHFLNLGDLPQAEQCTKEALKRVQHLGSSYYNRFTQGTLTIAKGGYAEALQEAKKLKTDLEADSDFWSRRDKSIRSGTVLYAYNLLRIACLQKELGSKEGELAAWNELIQNAGWGTQPKNPLTYDPESYALLASNFQKTEVSLMDFIHERKKALQEP